MTREETVKNLLTELIDMIDNGSQRDLDRADEIGASIIKLLEQEPVLDKIKAEIEPTRKMYLEMNDIDWLNGCDYVLSVIDKYKAESEE